MKWKNILVAVIYLVLVSGIIISAVYLYPRLRADEREGGNLCLTENCLKAALHIVSSINRSQDPCYDFYQFTCGNFIQKAYEKNVPSQYYAQKLNNEYKLNAIIAEPIVGDEVGFYLQQKRFYQSCMDVTTIDDEGFEPFKTLLGELGGWPVVEGQQWREEDFELNAVITKCMELGLPYQWFFELHISSTSLGIYPPRIKQYHDFSKEYVYLSLMIDTAINLGASNTSALNDMAKVFDFEKNLEAITIGQDESITSISLDELNITVPILPWLELITTINIDYMPLENDSVIYADDNYLTRLSQLLAGTPKRVQADFIIWKIVQEFGFYLPKPVREDWLYFTNLKVLDKQHFTTRFKFCIEESIARFPRIAQAEFIKRYVDEEKMEAIRDITLNIKNQFINRLSASDWIDDNTKKAGINKVKNIVDIISQHSLDFDENVINEFLKLRDLEFITSNIIEMIRHMNTDNLLKQLENENTTQIDFLTNMFFSKTFNVNAAYMESENIIFLPTGIIQDIFYDSSRPNYLNYGGLGSIIGHEIAHAFSKTATTHDSEEEREIITEWYNSTLQRIEEILFLNTSNLWQNDSLEALNSRMECVDEELINNVNKEAFTEEIFADLVGIDIAYEAYVAWAQQYEKEQQLPGLPFSPRQLFWIQFGAVNCYRHIDSVPWTVNTDNHPSLRYRIVNTLKNSENFAKDFKCPEASVMNPLEKCRVF